MQASDVAWFGDWVNLVVILVGLAYVGVMVGNELMLKRWKNEVERAKKEAGNANRT